MTTTDENVSNLIINKLTKSQYDTATKSDTELYLTVDELINSSDVTTALGYTPADNSLSNLDSTGEDKLRNLKSYELIPEADGYSEIYQEAHSTFDSSKFTITGSLTITNGVASGFSSSNYIGINNTISSSSDIIIEGEFTYGADVSNLQILLECVSNTYPLGGPISLRPIANNQCVLRYPTGNSTYSDTQNLVLPTTLTQGNSYKFKIVVNGNSISAQIDNSTPVSASDLYRYNINSIILGCSRNHDAVFQGSSDLKQFSITVDGVPVFSGNITGTDTYTIDGVSTSIPYTLSSSNEKYVDSYYRPQVNKLLISQGYTPYYTVDEVNKNFTIPEGKLYKLAKLGNRNIGEIIASSLPIIDARVHEFDGGLINGSGSNAQFVSYVAKLYEKSEKYANVVKVGSVTDTNGVLSGFSTDNYCIIQAPSGAINSFEIVFKVTTSSDTTTTEAVIGQVYTNIHTPQISGAGEIWVGFPTPSGWQGATIISSSIYAINTTYWIKMVYDGSYNKAYYSTDGETYTLASEVSNSNGIVWDEPMKIGLDQTFSPWLGSIDLNESYININGSRFWTGMQPIAFTDELQWQAFNTNYGTCGKFVYDNVNNTVRLPKIVGFVEGAEGVKSLGNITEAGLPNITGEWDNAGGVRKASSSPGTKNMACSGAVDAGSIYESQNDSISRTNNNTYFATAYWNINASRSSAVYGRSNTVQPQSVKVMYYIVIANAVKTELEVNIDNIVTDLNSKANQSQVDTISTKVDGYPKHYIVNGRIMNTSADSSLAGYGTATVILYSSGIAEVHFGCKVETSGTSSTGWGSGINRDLLHNLDSNIPVITPITGGTIYMYSSNGNMNTSLCGYGGTSIANGQFWTIARVYQTDGAVGGYPSSTLTAGMMFYGTLYGTYTVGTEG